MPLFLCLHCCIWWQNEGNSAAVAEKYSTALHLWNQAILLTPFRAQLHEQKAQVNHVFAFCACEFVPTCTL